MPLKSLAENDGERMKAYNDKLQADANGEPTGIACPNCGKELVNPTPRYRMMSMPPRMEVACKDRKCQYRGTALC